MAQARTSGTSRLPSTRESRPAMIGLAILLIVGGALASGYLALQAGNRASFIMVKQGVAPGAKISADDLGTVSLPENYAGGVPASSKGSILTQSATVRLLPGTVLSPAMVSKKGGIDPDKTQLPIPVDDTAFVRGLQPGASMALNIGAGTSSATGSGDAARQSVYAELVGVSKPKSSGGLGGSSSSSGVTLVVSVDVSCLSAVSQGVEDQAITPALIGDASNNAIQRTCRS